MSLEISFKLDSNSNSQHISLQDGEGLQVCSGEFIQIKNPENVAQLVPQLNDLRVVCRDGSSYTLRSFLDVDFAQEPTLELKDGTSITRHNFVQQLDGLDLADLPEEQYSQSLLLAPLHVIAVTSGSQKWDLSQYAPESEGLIEDSDISSENSSTDQPAKSNNQLNEGSNPAAATSFDSEGIELDPTQPNPTETASEGNASKKVDGIAHTTSTDADFIDIDIREFLPQSLQDGIPDDITITAQSNIIEPTEIQIDPAKGILRLPDTIFDDDPQRKFTISIRENGDETETAITVTQTKDGGGQTFHLILSHDRLAENIEGALIGKLDTDDGGRGHTYEYSILQDDAGIFEIHRNVLKLKDDISIDYEAQPDRYPITIVSTDENGNRIEQTVSIWPEDVNEPASLSSIGMSSGEDSVVSFNPEAFEESFEDEDSDYLEIIRIDSLPDSGVLFLNDEQVTNGQLIDIDQVENLEYHPDANQNGITNFTWSGFDGQSWSNESSSVNISITSVNDAPVVNVSIGDESTITDASFQLTLPENAFTDADLDDTLTYSGQLPSWLTIDPETGALNGIPGIDSIGDHNVTITATDMAGESVSQTFLITVEQANRAPTITQIESQSTDEDALFNLDVSGNFTDLDTDDLLTFSATLENGDPIPDWLSIDPLSGKLTGTPENEDVGSITISVTASDGDASATNSFALTIENTNDGPIVSSAIENQTAAEDAAFSLNVSNNFADEDLGDTLSYSATLENGDPLPDWITFDSESGQISGTPGNDDIGDIQITVTAFDGDEEINQSFTLSVENTNDAPILTSNIADTSAAEDAPFNLDVSSHFTDIDSHDELVFEATLENGEPLPDWLSFDESTGLFSGQPTNEDVGNLNISIVASDGEELASDTFTLTVENTNDGPIVIANIDDQTTNEDTVFNLDASAHFTDEDLGDTLSYSASLENGEPLPSWMSIDSETGQISGMPQDSDVGSISITVTANDGKASVSDTFSLTVENTDDGPVVSTSIDNQVTAEDAIFSLDTSSNFSDQDLGDELSYSATLENGDPLPTWLTINPETGEIFGTPENDDVGNVSITVTASDGEASASDTFSVTVENTNDGPVVSTSIDNQATNEDEVLNLDLAGNFSDEDLGDTLSYSAVLENGDPLPDWISFDSQTGSLSGTPRNADVGDFQIRVTASDGEAEVSQDFTLTVENVNDGPTLTANISNVNTLEDDLFSLNTSSNFSDQDLGDTLSYSAILENGDPLPDWLSIDGSNGRLSGTPENGDVGNISVTVIASDGEATISDTFSLTVFNTNDAPLVQWLNDNQALEEDALFSMDASSIFVDIDHGDSLSYSATIENGDPLPTWISINSVTGELSGTPENDDVGELSLTLTASDGEASTSKTFSLYIENTNDGPVVSTSIADQSTDEDAPFSLDVSINFADEDLGEPLTFSATLENGDPLPDWMRVDSETGEISGTPRDRDVGEFAVTVTASDGEASVSDTFSLTVENTNDGPTVTSNILDQSIGEDEIFSLDISGNFDDQDAGDTLSYSATLENGDPLPDWINIDSNTGEISGIPGDVNDLMITVTASDGEASVSDTFSISVENTNDGPIVTSSIVDRSTGEDASFSLDLSTHFDDPDLGDTLSYSATLEGGDPLPGWISIDSETGQLSGTPGNGDVGDLSVTVTASDGEASASDTFTLNVENTNDGPTVSASIVDSSTEEDTTFSLDVSGNFHDEDLGDTLTFTATLENGDPLPSWLSIDSATGQLSGTPTNSDVGNFPITVIASDEVDSASNTFSLTVENTNDGPTVSTNIADLETSEDSVFSLDVSGNFQDEDLGDTFTFTASLENGDPLPDWLSIDANTGQLSGTPKNEDVGNIGITVTASDGNASVSDTFSITVENTNDGPTVSANINYQTTVEDAAFSLDVTSNFEDEDLGDVLTYSASLENGDPLPAWLSIDPETGQLYGTPENGDVGNLVITVIASDGEASVSDTFSISVENTNDGPTVSTSIDNQTVEEDAAFSVDVSSNFQDEDLGDTLSFSATLENGDPLPSWLSIDSETGQVSGTPHNADVGDISITVTASDGEASASDTFSLSVENTNDGPTVSTTIGNQTAGEDEAFSLDVSGNFDDQDLGDALSYSATLENGDPLPDWLSIDSATGELSGSPGNGDVGNVSITVTASDGQASAEDTFCLSVENTNDGPVVSTVIGNQTTGEDTFLSLDFSENFSDEDLGDSLSFSATLENGALLPDWMSFDSQTGSLSGIPRNVDVGDFQIVVTASDGQAETSQNFTLTVENTNDGPMLTANIANINTLEDNLFSLDASPHFLDLDVGDTLTYAATLENGDPLPSWLTFDTATGVISGTPLNEDVGNIAVTISASDGEATISDTFNLSVFNTNDAPLVQWLNDNQAIEEDALFSMDASSIFVDVDQGDSLSFSATLENGDPLPAWISMDPETGILSGTPENEDVGELSLTLTASDGEASTSKTFSLNVENTNDGPVVTSSIADQSTDEDESFNLDASINFADEDLGEPLTYSATLENGDPLPGWMSIDSETGEISGTPRAGDVGDLSVTVTASDGEATASDTFSLTVENTNDGPVVSTNIAEQSTEEDAVFSLNVSGNFSDQDIGDTLSYSATLENGDPLPSWMNFDSATGLISGSPENGDVGTVMVTVTASDGEASVSDTFSLTVENTNDGPVVSTGISDANTNEDDAYTLDISGNFDDQDFGDTLTYSATLENGDPLPSWMILDSETGQISGTPRNSDVGSVSVTVYASDGEASVSDTFILTVENTNDGLIVSSNIANQAINEDSAFNLDISSNFLEEDIGDVLSYSATLENGDPLPGWLSLNSETGEIYGTPGNGDVGILSVTVTASDGEASASDTFTVTVENTNDGPTVSTSIADASTDEDTAFSLDISGNFADEDLGDTLTYSATLENGDPLPNWLSINTETGEISGTPQNGDVGNISISVTASDGESSASDTFSLTVENTNDGPVVSAQIVDQAINEENAFSLDVSGNFTDQDLGDILSFSATLENGDPLPEWITIDSETGELSGIPGSTDVGNISIKVTASDGTVSTSDTFSIDVRKTNKGPIANIDNAALIESSIVEIDVLANDTDDDDDALTITSASVPSGDGTVSIVNNKLVYHPGSDFADLAMDDTESIEITYTISDGKGGESSSTVNVTVTGDDSLIVDNGSSHTVLGTANSNTILGNDGHDTILGGDGDDIIIGGAGNDNLYGEGGDDVFQVSEGDGYDDFYGGDGTDTVRSMDGTDIRIDGHFSASNSVESIDAGGHSGVKVTGDASSQTLDFSATTLDGIESIDGGGGHDTITGTAGDDVIVGGTGHDDLHGGAGDDTFLVSEGDEYDDFFGGEGTDTVVSTDGTDIRIDGHFSADNSVESIDAGGHSGVKVTGDASSQTLDFSATTLDGIESIDGGAGHDTITGTAGDDVIVGGTGHDDLYGGAGDDTFLVSEGDEYDDFFGGEGTDTVVSTDGTDIRIDGHFSADNSVESIDAGGHSGVKVTGDASSQTLDFSATTLDGIESIDGGAGHDTITGTAGDDVIVGGTGHDDLYGGAGDDTFLVSEGDEYDDFFGGEGTDTVVSTDGTDIRIDGHFSADNSVESIDAGGHSGVKVTGDASSQTLDFSATTLDGIESIDGGAGHDTITGTAGDDVIVGGTGHDDLYGGAGDDTFLVSEGDEYDDFFGGEGTDTVVSTDGTDIRIDGHFSADNSVESIDAGGHSGVKVTGDASSQTLDFSATTLDGIESIDGGAGHDTITGTAGDDVIVGGTGHDDLYGGAGDDTFLVSEGDEYDDFFGGEGTDTVVSTDGTDIRIDGHFSADNSVESIDAGGHSGVKVTGDASSQTLDFSATTLDGIESIDGGAGHDTITGTAGDDVIVGGTGHDDLYGGAGDDTFLVSEGDEYDDFFGGEGTDTVVSTDGTDIRIDGHFSADNSVESIDAGGHSGVKVTGDASSQTLDFSATTLDGIESIDGGAGHDTITGTAGDDVIVGGTGHDDLHGGAGDDTFLVSEGDEYDDFFGGEGTDTVVSTDGTDIRIDGHFSADNSVESIDAGGHSGVKVTGDASSQTLDFSATTLDGIESIDGGAGHDTITGTAGDDVIVGGTGHDDLYGGAGDDTFLVSEGDEYDDFFGGEGEDTVKATEDNVDIGIDGHFSPSNSIENISADGNSNVTISGDGSSQTLDFSGTTLDGIQSIDAGGGHDTVTGSAADDTVEGGTGTDTYVLAGNRSDYYVTENEDGSYRVEDLVSGRGGVDTVSNFENFQFADGTLNSTDVLDNPPIVSSEIVDQNTDEDSLFSLNTSVNFQDIDGDTLTYSATLDNGDPLPSWLSIDSNTGELSGTPENGDVGGISVTVTASDGNASASDTFSITVDNTNDGPIAYDDNLSSFSPESATLTTEINFNDGVPSANYGTITQENDGMVGNAADFSSAKLSVTGIDLASDAGAKTTVSMWIQGDPSGSWEMLVGSERHDLVLLNGNIGFNTSQGDLFGSDASELSDGNWHHVVATFTNGDVTQNSIYIDGVDQSLSQIQGTPSSGDANIDSDSGTLHFGSWGYDDGYRFTGSMDEIKVYDGTLSTQEVGELYDIENSHNHWGNAGVSATEDTELVISPSDLLANDIDVDGDTLSITSVQDATHGTVEINVDGDIVFTPDANYNGEASFSYTVSDGNGGTNTASVTLNVDAVNDNISVVADTNASANSIAENAANGSEVGITAAAGDVDGDNISYSIVDGGGNTVTDGPFEVDANTGVITVRDDSQIDYESSTTHNIVVRATSSDGSTSTETFSVSVTDTNDGPTVSTSIADANTDEDAAFSLDVSGNFADEDVGDTLTYSATLQNGDPLPTWLTFNGATGQFSGTPDNDDVGSISVTVTASDGTASADDTFSLTVDNTNDGPTLTTFVEKTLWQEGFSDLSNGATSDNGDTAWSTDETAATISPTHGVSNEAYEFSQTTTTAGDDGALLKLQTESIDISGKTDLELTFDLMTEGGMEESGDFFDFFQVIAIVDGEEHEIHQQDGNHTSGDNVFHTISLTGLPEGDSLALSFEAKTTVTSEIFTLDNIRLDGDALGIANQTVNEEAAFSLDVSSSFADEDVGDTLTYSATLENGDPLPTWLSIDSNTGILSGTPSNGEDGSISVTVTASDGTATASDTFDITVNDTLHNLIGQWKLDESSGTSAADSAGANDGVYTNGVTLGVDGVLDTGSAASFDGVNDYVEIAPSTDFQVDDGTLVMSFKTDAVSGTQTLFSRDSSGYDGGGHLTAYVESDGTLTVRFQSDSTSYLVSSASSAVDAGTNHQMAFSFGANGMELSLDGVVVDTDAYTGGIGGNNEPIVIGVNQWGSGDGVADVLVDYFNGTIDNVEIYDGQLSESAIDALYAQVDDNSAPIANTLISDQSVDEDAAFSLDVSSNFSDADVGDTLTFSATLQNGDPLPTWLTFDANTQQFSGTPADGDDGTISVKVTASDGEASTFDTFDIDVLAPPELIGQWKLDESSGTSAADSVGTNDGVYTNGVTLGVDGVLDTGSAASFDGSNDYVEVAPSTDFQIDNGTFVMAFKTDSLSGQQTLFSRDSSGYDGGGHLDAYVESDGTLTVRFQSATSSYYVSSDAGAVDAGTNHQIAFSFGSKGMELSLDGAVVDTDAYTGGIGGNNEPITIGASQSSSGNDIANNMHDYFNGTIDNLEVYDGQLSESAIDALYAQVDDNSAPIANTLISDQSVDEDAAFSLDVSSNFSDADVGDTLTFSATLQNGDPLPTWLSFNTTTGQFSGTPSDGDDGTISVKVTASDGEASTFDTFDIDVLPPPELIGQWKLDETTGTSASDSSGANDGVYTHGVVLNSNGVLDSGTAASFDGVNDYVEIAPSTDFQLANGTFVVSFNADDLSTDRTLFSRDSSGFDGGGHLDAYVEADGTVAVRFQSPDHSYYIESAAGAVSVGENHQMAFSFGSKGVQLFLDGTLVDTDAYTGDIQGNNEPITIGASQVVSGDDIANNLQEFFSGRIDNLEIYDGQISQSDVDNLYAQLSDPDQSVTGTAGTDSITTGSGDDTIDTEGGADTVDSGLGDDTIIIEDTSFNQLDFGTGEDTLEISGAGIDLDFSLLDASKLTNVETIDLNGTGANSIHLSASDVLDMTDGDKTLFIEGGSDDTVDISTDFSNQGTHTVDGVDYSHYYDAGTDSHLYINSDITDLNTF